MQLDLTTFLRRWAIILLEDAMFHVHYPVLVWFMAAVSRGFNLPDECIAWILGHVQATAEYGTRLLINLPQEDFQPVKLDSKDIHFLPSQQRDLIYALQMRKAYGGMSGDSVMLDEITAVLSLSLIPTKKWPVPLIKHMSFPIALEHPCLIKPLEIHEWEMAGIDFHVSDIVEKWHHLLDSQDTQLWTKDDLKGVMWTCSGGVNRRQILVLDANGNCHRMNSDKPDPRMAVVWKKYESSVLRLARGLLEAKVIKTLGAS
jgi:hypothetical protein